jgi:hypothetical protein
VTPGCLFSFMGGVMVGWVTWALMMGAIERRRNTRMVQRARVEGYEEGARDADTWKSEG